MLSVNSNISVDHNRNLFHRIVCAICWQWAVGSTDLKRTNQPKSDRNLFHSIAGPAGYRWAVVFPITARANPTNPGTSG